jgi:cytochrome c
LRRYRCIDRRNGVLEGRDTLMRLATIVATAFFALTATAFAEGDVANGEKVFKKCGACHVVGPEAKNRVGPQLNGIVGGKIAAVEGFKYSPAMVEFGAGDKVWDAETLDAYLASPKGLVPKTRMAFAGLKKEDERADVIAYLAQFAEDGSTK